MYRQWVVLIKWLDNLKHPSPFLRLSAWIAQTSVAMIINSLQLRLSLLISALRAFTSSSLQETQEYSSLNLHDALERRMRFASRQIAAIVRDESWEPRKAFTDNADPVFVDISIARWYADLDCHIISASTPVLGFLFSIQKLRQKSDFSRNGILVPSWTEGDNFVVGMWTSAATRQASDIKREYWVYTALYSTWLCSYSTRMSNNCTI